MKGTRAVALLVAALVVAAVLAVVVIHERTPPRSPVEFVPTTWRTARDAPMHVFHVGTKKLACTECHESVDGKGAVPDARACAKCHEPEVKRGHRGNAKNETTCLSCHVFGAEKSVAACADCHGEHAPKQAGRALAHHASSSAPCGFCHSIHSEPRAVLADCTTCHDGITATHGRFEAHPSADRAVPAGSVTELSMDAAVLAFIREAGAPTTPFNVGAIDASADPRSMPPGQVCGACHAPHTGKEAARGTCAGCHAKAQVVGHAECVTCHEPHRARRTDARTCESCHADHRDVTAVKGHANCSGCHASHAPSEARGSCTTCHATLTTLGSASVPAAGKRVAAGTHAECGSCHDPHRPKVPAAASCVRCHEGVKPSHPATASPSVGAGAKAPGACIGCHAPHGHREPSADATAHASSSPRRAACSTCHASAKDDRAFHAKGMTCTQCHAPHAFRLAGAGAKLCANCHAAKVAATSVRPGHASCEGCHGGPHTPVAKPSCQGCHAQESASAPKGHATCTSCHDAHTGSLGARSSCTSCHENKKKALHASIPVGVAPHSQRRDAAAAASGEGCANCHRAHGPNGVAQPAACNSCHARSSLGGLHSVGAHTPCQSCHTAHAPAKSDRATCTSSCHADRRTHQPEAKVCNGCHIFRH